MSPARKWVERVGFGLLYGLADLTYAVGIPTPKRTVAGTYWSYEPTNPHGDDPGLAALDALPDDATVVDAGAHVGEHAIPLALSTDRHVVAVEPNGESADRLVRNARRNGLQTGDGDRGDAPGENDGAGVDAGGAIDLRRAGLGDANATFSFYRSTFSKLSAFDRDRATRWGAAVADVEAVPIRRLDDLVPGIGRYGAESVEGSHPESAGPDDRVDLIPPPDAIKIDVEGCEDAVLRGAKRTIETHRPLLVVEVHDGAAEGGEDTETEDGDAETNGEPLRDWLTDRGYAIEPAGDVWICRG